jgi:hypothetical protein
MLSILVICETKVGNFFKPTCSQIINKQGIKHKFPKNILSLTKRYLFSYRNKMKVRNPHTSIIIVIFGIYIPIKS